MSAVHGLQIRLTVPSIGVSPRRSYQSKIIGLPVAVVLLGRREVDTEITRARREQEDELLAMSLVVVVVDCCKHGPHAPSYYQSDYTCTRGTSISPLREPFILI